MEKKQQFTILFLLIIIAPYVYLSFFCHPMADDFTYSILLRKYTLWEATLNVYTHITGRYFSDFLMVINPMAFNQLLVYKLLPIIIIAVSFFAIYLFIKEATNSLFKKTNYIVASLLLTALYLTYMPNLAEGIYWYTGYATYHLSVVFLLIYSTFTLKLLKRKSNISWPIFLFTIVLLFATMGFNEYISVLVFLSLIVINYLLYKHKKVNSILLIHLLFGSLFFLLIIFSPGNFARDSLYPNNHQFLQSGIMSLLQTLRFSLKWINLTLVLLSILYLPIHQQLKKQVPIFKNSFHLTPAISTFILFFILFMAAFLPYFATGILGQHRTINLSYFMFLLFWFVNITVWVNYYKVEINLAFINKYATHLIVFVFISLMFTGNSYNALTDIFYGRHKTFNQQMNHRLEKLKTSSTDTVYFEKIKNPPASLFVLDVTENPRTWMNRGYLIFFSKEDKVLVGVEPNK